MDLSREDKKLQGQIDQGWQLFVARRYDDALHLFHSLLLIDPNSALANSVAGACLVRLGHFEEAEKYARSGVRLAPGVALAHVFLAEALTATEQYEEAEAEYWEAIAVNPSAPAPQIELGRFLLAQGRHHEARARIENAMKTTLEDADAHYLMAICNSRDEATEEALKEIDLAIKLVPTSDLAWHFRGLVLMSRAKGVKKKQEMIAVFRDVSESLRKAVELNSSNAEAREHLKAVYNAIAAINQYLDSVAELRRSWWQIVLCVAGLVIFAILDRSLWINALILVAAFSALAVWRNRRRIAGVGPDPFASIHPLQLRASTAGLRSITNAQLVNEWVN